MPSEFLAVEAYLSHFDNLNPTSKMALNNNSSSDMQTDQKVPQLSSLCLLDEDMMFCDIKTEPDSSVSFFKLNDPFSFGGDVKLAPVAPMNCTPVEVNDQQLTGDQSPIHHLLDLDHVNQDITFYPDTMIPSAQIKQELPDIPSGCTEYSYDPQPQNFYMYSEQNNFKPLENFIVHQARKDIEEACTSLQISPDPTAWTAEQSQKWVRWTLEHNEMSTLDAYLFMVPGSTLCQFSEADFRIRSQDCGSTLYFNLEIWKNTPLQNQIFAAETKPQALQETTYTTFQDVIPRPVAAVSPSPSLSPAPSTSSIDSHSSSSNSSMGFSANSTIQFDFLSTGFESDRVLEKPTRHHPNEHKQTIHLWQFLKELLIQAQANGNCIKWLDREKGIFKIEDSSRVARLWGKRKNRPAMNYDKLSRSIRQYYKKGIIKKTEHSKRLVYQFCKPYL